MAFSRDSRAALATDTGSFTQCMKMCSLWIGRAISGSSNDIRMDFGNLQLGRIIGFAVMGIKGQISIKTSAIVDGLVLEKNGRPGRLGVFGSGFLYYIIPMCERGQTNMASDRWDILY